MDAVQQRQQKSEDHKASQNFYIGKEGDKIDTALADFLNWYPERSKIKILFLRESEGVYKFGTRRVHVKVGRGNEVLVRVGGGFISAYKFID